MTFRLTYLFLCCLIAISSHARNLAVQVQSHKNIPTVSFIPDGSYSVYVGKTKILNLRKNEAVKITAADNLVTLNGSKHRYGSYARLKFVAKTNTTSFTIKPENSSGNSYYDHLEITSKGKILKFINVVDLEKYVEGTVAAEAGKDATEEYYKVQAIICRTYALGHLQRHGSEGFDLCDRVHCQAYNGIWGKQ